MQNDTLGKSLTLTYATTLSDSGTDTIIFILNDSTHSVNRITYIHILNYVLTPYVNIKDSTTISSSSLLSIVWPPDIVDPDFERVKATYRIRITQYGSPNRTFTSAFFTGDTFSLDSLIPTDSLKNGCIYLSVQAIDTFQRITAWSQAKCLFLNKPLSITRNFEYNDIPVKFIADVEGNIINISIPPDGNKLIVLTLYNLKSHIILHSTINFKTTGYYKISLNTNHLMIPDQIGFISLKFDQTVITRRILLLNKD